MEDPVDHVVFAGPDLEALKVGFEATGLPASYGGVHSNGVTHNYTIGFKDRSYVELISKLDSRAPSPWWDAHIDGESGPAAWALYVEDIHTETERLAGRGIPVDGPTHYQRERPDGTLVEWDLTVVGDRELGTEVPFLVSDRTPRDYRVNVARALRSSALTGVAEVVVAVADLERTVELYRSLFNCACPVETESAAFEATLARLPDTPVTLATPANEGSWLADRIETFGPAPCAFLLGTDSTTSVTATFDLSAPDPWIDGDVRWFNLPFPGRLGVVARHDN